ncbi:MAG: DEAD/DEAH box helicase, partial [Pseudomonadota bacterium]
KSIAKKGRKPLLAAYSQGSAKRIASILEEAGCASAQAGSWQEALGLAAKGTIAAMVLPLEAGFASDELELLTEQDVLGDRLVRRKKKRKDADAFLAELQALARGDLVVHVEHGIGKYLGLDPITVGKSQHDCVALEYHGGDKLFIPVENIDVLSRYGSSEEAVPLDRLGGEAWQKRRARLKERITAIAGELMKVAAERALKKAPVFEAEESTYNPFVDRFPWEETEDQDAAIADVLRDLESGKPMDRLVCGDVGFGKTEVALRAAFVTAMSGQQVAVVAPTTLLARQHFQSFSERFAGFPLKVGRLSRLVSTKEANETRDGLADGTVDLVIGTHAILSKSTTFKNLGLVIVDEEQRFGVTHKEKLKQLRSDVHMLTLTATPIPRTLQMAMTGLRGWSPPRKRTRRE